MKNIIVVAFDILTTNFAEPKIAALDFIESLIRCDFETKLYSMEDSKLIKEWLIKYNFPTLEIIKEIPDSVCFLNQDTLKTGSFDAVANFKPYWEKK